MLAVIAAIFTLSAAMTACSEDKPSGKSYVSNMLEDNSELVFAPDDLKTAATGTATVICGDSSISPKSFVTKDCHDDNLLVYDRPSLADMKDLPKITIKKGDQLQFSFEGEKWSKINYSAYTDNFYSVDAPQTSLKLPEDAGSYYASFTMKWGNKSNYTQVEYFFAVDITE